jgi:hypothetical protein
VAGAARREVEDLRRQLDAVVALDPAWPSDLPTAAPE